MTKKTFMSAITLTVALLAGAQPAHAQLNELIRLIRSPMGRFIFQETPEGSLLARYFTGSSRVVTPAERRALVEKIVISDDQVLTHEIQTRLESIESDFQIFMHAPKVRSPMRLLRRLARQRLRLASEIHTRQVSLIPYRETYNTARLRMEFLEGLESQRIAPISIGADLRKKLRLPEDKAADLDGADIQFANMQGVEISRSQVNHAILNWSDLTEANLEFVQMRGTQLRNATLSKARMKGADLSGADLRDADLSHTHMTDIVLRDADLRGADLTGVYWSPAGFRMADDITADLTGALFDETTRLPFNREAARRLGMIFKPSRR